MKDSDSPAITLDAVKAREAVQANRLIRMVEQCLHLQNVGNLCDACRSEIRAIVAFDLSLLDVTAEIWNKRSNLANKLHCNPELNRRERAELAGEARAYGICANELIANLEALHTKRGW